MASGKEFIVIIAGGRGERFWPMSRVSRPKHFLDVFGDKTLIEQTVERAKSVVALENILIVTNQEHVSQMKTLFPEFNHDQILGEPLARDTCAAIALGTAWVKKKDSKAVFAVLPADHIIENKVAFKNSLKAAYSSAVKDSVLVTLGVRPITPATGYGYMKRGGGIKSDLGVSVYHVDTFVEKPDLKTAEKYLASGQYYWNAGMFVWSVSSIEDAFNLYAPSVKKLLDSDVTNDEVLQAIYPELDKISIDYAILENAGNVVVLEADFDWDDVGAWTSLDRHMHHDSEGNILRGAVSMSDSNSNIVLNTDPSKIVGLVGVSHLVVVQTKDALLVCPKSEAQNVKKLVNQLGDSDYKQFI